MSSFWNFVTTMVSGTLARAEDVNTNLSGIDTGLNLVETELAKCIQITNSPGTVDIGENAAARANKIVAFNAAGGIELGTTIGSYRGNHANAAGTAYYVRDVVKDAAASLGLNNLYICTTAHTSTGGLLADTANWALLVDVASVVASEVAAAASAAAAATSYDNFDDRYLGSFTTAASPTLDNDGNAIITGALFFDTTLNRMKVRTTGATWVLTTANAVDVNITDAGARITATEVEGALQEIAADNWVTTARIVDDAVTNAELANMDTQRIKGRTTAGTGDPEDLTAAQVSTMLGTVATQAGAETLTNKTLTSPVLNGTLSGTAFLDEDAMTSNSAIATVSQQSVKAYVDGPAFKAYRGGISYAHTSGEVRFDTEEFDTAACYNTATYRFTPNKAGYYQVQFEVWASNSASNFILTCYKNGTDTVCASAPYFDDGASEYWQANGLTYMNGTTDYLSVQFSDTRTVYGDQGTGIERTVFSGFFVRN